MKLTFTQQALDSLQEALGFLANDVPVEKLIEIRDAILSKAHKLVKNFRMGQKEEYLDHLGQSHRRIIEGNFKIIYRVEDDTIFITDIFNTRQDPSRMKG